MCMPGQLGGGNMKSARDWDELWSEPPTADQLGKLAPWVSLGLAALWTIL